jgi:hypothetical protein
MQEYETKMSRTQLCEEQDVSRTDTLLAELTSGRLAERIAEAARLAWSRHLVESARLFQSEAEAESSGH